MASVEEFDQAVRAALADRAAVEPGTDVARLIALDNEAQLVTGRMAATSGQQEVRDLCRRAYALNREKAALVPRESRFRPGVLSDVVKSASNILHFGEDPAIRAEMLHVAREGVAACEQRPASPTIEVSLRSAVCNALISSQPVAPSAAEVEEAIAAAEPAVELARDYEGAFALALLLARAYLVRHDMTGSDDDLDRAAHVARQARESAREPAHAAAAYVLLGNACLRFDRRTDAAHAVEPDDRLRWLDLAISAFDSAARMAIQGSVNEAAARASARNARRQRVVRRYALDDRPDRPFRLVAAEDVSELDDVIAELRRDLAALDAQGGRADSTEIVDTLNSLAVALRSACFLHGDMQRLREAIDVLVRAAGLADPDDFERANVLHNLGLDLWEVWRNDSHLVDDLVRGHLALAEASEIVAGRFLPLPLLYQLDDQRDWAQMRSRVVTSALEAAAADPDRRDMWGERAFLAAEGLKSRLLTSMLGRLDLPSPPGVTPQEAEHERQLLDEMRRLDAAEMQVLDRQTMPTSERADVARRRHAASGELGELWARLRARGLEEDAYVRLRSGQVLDREAVARLCAALPVGTAILSLFAGHDRCAAWVITAGPDGATSTVSVEERALDPTGLHAVQETFRAEVDLVGKDFGEETWSAPLLPLVEPLRDVPGLRTVLVVPHGPLHLFPWVAVLAHASIGAPDGPPAVITCPALSVYAAGRAGVRPHHAGTLVVGDPHGDLPFAAEEARTIARDLGGAAVGGGALIGPHADRATVLAHLARCNVAHLATHALFDTTNPLDSGIVLADGVLTARDLLEHHLDLDLLVLSACDSGRATAMGGDELVGLSQACLQAGVRTVVVSLWPVLDTTTSVLMRAFHSSLQQGNHPPQALADAAAAVHARHAHSYHWAPFVVMGSGQSAWAAQPGSLDHGAPSRPDRSTAREIHARPRQAAVDGEGVDSRVRNVRGDDGSWPRHDEPPQVDDPNSASVAADGGTVHSVRLTSSSRWTGSGTAGSASIPQGFDVAVDTSPEFSVYRVAVLWTANEWQSETYTELRLSGTRPGTDSWGVRIASGSERHLTFRFAIVAAGPGGKIWDNNNGANYSIL
jgi:hypothetical protein